VPEKLYIAVGASLGLIVAAFLLAGAHHEIKYRLRERRYGGWLR
jgi:hypothetical protein